MVLETIYLVRHGFRLNMTFDHRTGAPLSPPNTHTGLYGDPVLTAHGIKQSEELAKYVVTLDPPIDVVYSSPFHRCVHTIAPSVDALSTQRGRDFEIRGENGLCDWFGKAPFTHPYPADTATMHNLFPAYSTTYKAYTKPDPYGETLDELHARMADVLSKIVSDLDTEPSQPKAVIICMHAATIIASGRVLTGIIPEDYDTRDFHTYTCGLSRFDRRTGEKAGFKGVGGGWDCTLNSFCGFLSGGEERGWYISGDESFVDFSAKKEPPKAVGEAIKPDDKSGSSKL